MQLIQITFVVMVVSQFIFSLFFIFIMAFGKKKPLESIDWDYHYEVNLNANHREEKEIY